MKAEKKLEAAVLVLVLAVAAALRLHHIDFGAPFTYHPDEIKLVGQAGRLLATKFMDKATFFGLEVYPPFFTYMLAGALALFVGFGLLTGRFASLAAVEAAYRTDPFPFFLTGRLLSVLLGVAVVLLLFLIVRRLYGKGAAVVAALAAAVNPVLVNHAHFSTVDTAACFWGLAGIYFCVRIGESGRWADFLLAAAAVAVAAATKFNMALFALPLLVAHLSRYPWRKWPAALVDRKLLAGAAAGVVAFLIACPIIWLDFRETLGGILGTVRFEKIGKIGSGGGPLAYWTGDLAEGYGVFYPNSLPDSFGIPAVLLCAGGIVLLFIRHRKNDLLLLFSILPMYLLLETMTYKAIRHLLPLIPFLLAAASVFIFEIGRRRRLGVPAAALLLTVIVVFQVAQNLAYWRDMGNEDPRTRARNWIATALPKRALLLVEDYPPPLVEVKDDSLNGFRIVSLGITKKKTGIADSVKSYLKTEPKLYYIADGFTRQTFAWKQTRVKYPDITWDRVQFFDWLDRSGKLLKRFDSDNPRLQPEIFIYELTGKRR